MGRVIVCDITYTPNPSGNYSVMGACITPDGRSIKIPGNRSLSDIVHEAIKVGSGGGESVVKGFGSKLRVRYELVGKREVVMLSSLGLWVISIIALAVVVGAAYTLINWRRYAIH